MRALTEPERHAILALAAELGSDEERQQLLTDLIGCSVEERVPDGSLLEFSIAGYPRPVGHGQHAYRGKDKFPVEGVMQDADGAEISVYLFADIHNRLYELELDRHAEGSVVKARWDTFKVR